MPSLQPFRRLIPTLGIATVLATAATGTTAQNATPPVVGAPDHTHPVSIHEGTCEAPVAQPVGTTTEADIAGQELEGEFVGVTSQPPAMTATVNFDGSLEDLTAKPHVIAIHASPDEFGVIMACGEIAGYEQDGNLIIPLRSMPGEDVSGIAVAHEGTSLLDRALEELGSTVELNDNGVTVTVYIVPSDMEPGDA